MIAGFYLNVILKSHIQALTNMAQPFNGGSSNHSLTCCKLIYSHLNFNLLKSQGVMLNSHLQNIFHYLNNKKKWKHLTESLNGDRIF